MDNKLKFIDLFCGIGGFHQALKKYDYECVMACDIDEKCRNTYFENYGIVPEKDIKLINEKNVPDFDILCAGFPCFIAGTKVLSFDGYKNIEDININDKLLTHNGKYQNILNLQNKIYSGYLYNLNVNYHNNIITCTEEHPFYIRTKNSNGYDKPIWKKIKDITINDYVGMVINTDDLKLNDLNINDLEIQRLYLKLGYIYDIKTKSLYNNNKEAFIEDNYVWFSIKNIDKNNVENIKVYNFEVENDNSYIVENIIVHNCQSFSNSGKKGNLSDPRGLLFEDILRIADYKKPKFMFLENVKHIKKIDNGKTFKHIIKRINETGYYVNDKETIFELSPHNLGIPQQRERVIFVCINKDIYDINKKINFILPNIPIDIDKILETNKELTNKYKISKDIENVLNIWDEMIQLIDINETLSPTILCNEFYKKYNEDDFIKLPLWKKDYIEKNKPLYLKYKSKWDEWYDKYKDILQSKEINGKLEWQTGKKKTNDSIWNYFIQLRQSGIRVKKTNYFPTLVAIVQTPILGKEKRYITPRECARLQSFPDNFIIHSNDKIAYKQFGNAVNVDVVSFIIDLTLKTYCFI